MADILEYFQFILQRTGGTIKIKQIKKQNNQSTHSERRGLINYDLTTGSQCLRAVFNMV